jgi:hypothetical protein
MDAFWEWKEVVESWIWMKIIQTHKANFSVLPTSELVHLVALGGLIDVDAVNVGGLELMGEPFADSSGV